MDHGKSYYHRNRMCRVDCSNLYGKSEFITAGFGRRSARRTINNYD
jgi:hypothetical protein